MIRSRAAAYLSLTKPTIVLLFAVTGFAAIVVDSSLLANPLKLLFVMFAMIATAGSANALNMYFDRDIDAVMERTRRRRPIPLELVSPKQAAIFGTIIGLAAILYFYFATNILAAFLSFFTIAFYVGIYTLWLKRKTPYNIVIGGAAGSTAPLLGCAAATGHLSPLSWALFFVVFLWTPPHFWALAISLQDEYAKAKIPMLPVTHGADRTRLEILLYTLILLPVSTLPYFMHANGVAYLASAIFLGAFYLTKTIVYQRLKTKEASKKLFWVSILYLFLLFIALLLDAWFLPRNMN